MKFILGQKQEMSQMYKDDKVVPITVIKAGLCKITQIKNKEKDGYAAVQIGCGSRKKINKPLKGHLKKASAKSELSADWNLKYIKEFRQDGSVFNIGETLDIESFQPGDKIKVSGISKGKGFQGVVRRHGFKGQPTSHGTKDQVRMPGSIGATGPAHVFKGTRMAGQMGNGQISVTNLEIIEIDKENNIIKVKGAVPGHRNSLIALEGHGEMKVVAKKEEEKVEEKEIKEENSEEKIENIEEKEDKTKENNEEK